VRRFLAQQVPICAVSATPFNLLGLDRWIPNFSSSPTATAGRCTRVFSPSISHTSITSGEEIAGWLLVTPVRALSAGAAGVEVVMVFFI
jgi:hypothetical protein